MNAKQNQKEPCKSDSIITGVFDWIPLKNHEDWNEIANCERGWLKRWVAADRYSDDHPLVELRFLLGAFKSNNCFPLLGRRIEDITEPNDRCVVSVSSDEEPRHARRFPPAVAMPIAGTPAGAGENRSTAIGDFLPADTLWFDHGIRRNRLAEAATAGKVDTKPAPKGWKDSMGRKVLKLYNRKQAIKHCSATNTAPK